MRLLTATFCAVALSTACTRHTDSAAVGTAASWLSALSAQDTLSAWASIDSPEVAEVSRQLLAENPLLAVAFHEAVRNAQVFERSADSVQLDVRVSSGQFAGRGLMVVLARRDGRWRVVHAVSAGNVR